jgi:hypothetical protein
VAGGHAKRRTRICSSWLDIFRGACSQGGGAAFKGSTKSDASGVVTRLAVGVRNSGFECLIDHTHPPPTAWDDLIVRCPPRCPIGPQVTLLTPSAERARVLGRDGHLPDERGPAAFGCFDGELPMQCLSPTPEVDEAESPPRSSQYSLGHGHYR